MDWRDIFSFALFVIVLVGSLLSVVFSIGYVIEAVQVNTMQKLGYEAKQVNFDCYAKVNNRWFPCDIAKYQSPK